MKPVKRTNFPFLSGWYVASISSGGVVMCDTGTWLRHTSATRLLGRLTMASRTCPKKPSRPFISVTRFMGHGSPWRDPWPMWPIDPWPIDQLPALPVAAWVRRHCGSASRSYAAARLPNLAINGVQVWTVGSIALEKLHQVFYAATVRLCHAPMNRCVALLKDEIVAHNMSDSTQHLLR